MMGSYQRLIASQAATDAAMAKQIAAEKASSVDTGEFYPAVIATIEKYSDDGALLSTRYEVTAFGRTQSYRTVENAYCVARNVAKRGYW